jgi:hypothetical protein
MPRKNYSDTRISRTRHPHPSRPVKHPKTAARLARVASIPVSTPGYPALWMVGMRFAGGVVVSDSGSTLVESTKHQLYDVDWRGSSSLCQSLSQ